MFCNNFILKFNKIEIKCITFIQINVAEQPFANALSHLKVWKFNTQALFIHTGISGSTRPINDRKVPEEENESIFHVRVTSRKSTSSLIILNGVYLSDEIVKYNHS